MRPEVGERIVACLRGIACGDAIGKQTENLSREELVRWYPEGVRGFEGAPGTPIPRYRGNARHEWLIGETTDDTEGTIAVARAILRDGEVRHASVGRELLGCTKSVHPGVKSLWEFHQAGDPARVAQAHDGCGAAIRVAPVGIVIESRRLDAIVAAARESAMPTHGGDLAIAAAAATAAAVSAAIDGLSASDILQLAVRAAGRTGGTGATFAAAIRGVHELLAPRPGLDAVDLAAGCFPDRPLTIVPLALALGTVLDSADTAILLATNIGGDSDSVASIAGGILGARFPTRLNANWCAVVRNVNGHELEALAYALGRLRR